MCIYIYICGRQAQPRVRIVDPIWELVCTGGSFRVVRAPLKGVGVDIRQV